MPTIITERRSLASRAQPEGTGPQTARDVLLPESPAAHTQEHVMTTSSRTTTAIALAVGSAVLSACGAAGSAGTTAQGSPAGADRLARQTQEYVGDPWERRYRDQFLARQHVHDSWNPCHLGENVLKSMQDQGSHCYDRLRSNTGR